jgi:glutaredoxin
MVKKYLKSKGAQYDEVNIDEQPERQKDAYELSGQLSVPITVVTKQDDSRQIVVGYNLAQLAPALG